MERVKRSLEQLATPICECDVEMAWFRSERMILHNSSAPRCGGIVETKTPVKASKE
jgi:hypothetical protein